MQNITAKVYWTF